MAFDYTNYKRLEYLESTGTQYIQSESVIASNTWCEFKTLFTEAYTWNFLLGGWGTTGLSFGGNGSGEIATLGSKSHLFGGAPLALYNTYEEYECTVGADLGLIMNGSLVYENELSSSIRSTGYKLWLFASSDSSHSPETSPYSWVNGSNIGKYGCGRFYDIKTFDGITGSYNRSTLTGHYIPAQRKSDGTLGLFNEVTGNFLVNAGTGTFIAGPESYWLSEAPDASVTYAATYSTSNKAYEHGSTQVPAIYGNQSWGGSSNSFELGPGAPSLNADNGIDEEGFLKESCTVTTINSDKVSLVYPYTLESSYSTYFPKVFGNWFVTQRTSGPNVIVTSLVPEHLAGIGVAKSLYADNVYNAVWNDIADCIAVPEETELEYGRCYCFDGSSYYKSDIYLADGAIGIHSDTAGYLIGHRPDVKQLYTASAGFVLAYVDKEYKPGTPLTCGPDGCLTEIKKEDIRLNPHKVLATFWKPEHNTQWGYGAAKYAGMMVNVNGRMWVKVR